MASGPLSIKLRCASWHQLATIYKRDLSRGSMFLKAATPPPIGTSIRIDLTLPSTSVVVLTGVVQQHVEDPQRGAGVQITLAPIPPGTIWMIESALASEAKRLATPATGVSTTYTTGPVPTITEGEDVATAENELIKALVAEVESLKQLNPFLVLGVGYESSDGDVRAAFGELTKRYHPDRFARYESSELRQVAAEIFILIRDAYRKLGDETSRAQVLAALGRHAAPPRPVPLRAPTPPPVPPPPPPPKRPSTPLAAPLPKPPEARLPSGARLTGEPVPKLTAGPLRSATPPGGLPALPKPPAGLPALDPPKPPPGPQARSSADGAPRPVADPRGDSLPAVSTLPTTPRASADQRNALIKTALMTPAAPPPPIETDRKPIHVSPPPVLTEGSDGNPLDALLDAGRLDEAIAAYKVMAKRHPQDLSFRAGIELCEGLRALANRDRLEAAQRFEAALEIDPSNERAARELADMRRQATNERKGLLSRLMGKKET